MDAGLILIGLIFLISGIALGYQSFKTKNKDTWLIFFLGVCSFLFGCLIIWRGL